jgi:ATP-dependent exoDNAse (exonuclease V) alpha subunit
VEERHVVVRGAGGEHKLTGKQARSFDVLESSSMQVAPGDRLLLTANRREAGFRATNGEVVTVSRIDGAGRIELEDGRRLPTDFHQFAHGYAVTAHRSQGKSVDAVIISADGMQKELFYVAASRGRQSIQVVTSDKERLQQTVGRSTARKSASELWRSAAGRCSPRGAGRGLSAAREMVRRAARFIASIPQRIRERTSEHRKERRHERGFGR